MSHDIDDDGNCVDCGVNHKEKAEKMFPEWVFLNDLYRHVLDNGEQDVPEPISRFMFAIVNQEMGEAIQSIVLRDNVAPKVAIETYCSATAEQAFVMGLMAREFYESAFPVFPAPTAERIEQVREERKREEEFEPPTQEQIMEALKNAGLVPDGAEPVVYVGTPDDIRSRIVERLSGDDHEEGGSAPGMYL